MSVLEVGYKQSTLKLKKKIEQKKNQLNLSCLLQPESSNFFINWPFLKWGIYFRYEIDVASFDLL